MAHKKAQGSNSQGRDSQAKRLGVKLYTGQKANAGSIIIRQRGTKWRAGKNVRQGSDDTLYAALPGVVSFASRKVRSFTGKLVNRKFVSVAPGAK